MENNNQHHNQLTPNEQADHDRSIRDYPQLDLDDDEYIVIDVERSKIGLVLIWLVVIATFSASFVMFFMVPDSMSASNSMRVSMNLIGVFFALLVLLGGVVASNIYRANYFILSNKRVFAKVQNAPFVYRTQTVELEHVEDVSVARNNVLQVMLDYGSIRLSTVGDEHTYGFTFSKDPESQAKVIKKVIQVVDEGESTRYMG